MIEQEDILTLVTMMEARLVNKTMYSLSTGDSIPQPSINVIDNLKNKVASLQHTTISEVMYSVREELQDRHKVFEKYRELNGVYTIVGPLPATPEAHMNKEDIQELLVVLEKKLLCKSLYKLSTCSIVETSTIDVISSQKDKIAGLQDMDVNTVLFSVRDELQARHKVWEKYRNDGDKYYVVNDASPPETYDAKITALTKIILTSAQTEAISNLRKFKHSDLSSSFLSWLEIHTTDLKFYDKDVSSQMLTDVSKALKEMNNDGKTIELLSRTVHASRVAHWIASHVTEVREHNLPCHTREAEEALLIGSRKEFSKQAILDKLRQLEVKVTMVKRQVNDGEYITLLADYIINNYCSKDLVEFAQDLDTSRLNRIIGEAKVKARFEAKNMYTRNVQLELKSLLKDHPVPAGRLSAKEVREWRKAKDSKPEPEKETVVTINIEGYKDQLEAIQKAIFKVEYSFLTGACKGNLSAGYTAHEWDLVRAGEFVKSFNVADHFHDEAQVFTSTTMPEGFDLSPEGVITNKGTTMKFESKPVEKFTRIFGVEIGPDTPTSSLTAHVRNIKDEISTYDDIKDTGSYVTNQIAKLEVGLEAILKELNTKARA